MSKIDKLLKSLNSFIKEAEEDNDEKLTNLVPDFPGLDQVPQLVEDYEKKVAKLLRNQRKHFVSGVKSFVSKDITLAALLIFLTGDLFAEDEFEEEMEGITVEFLSLTIVALASEMMEAIDKDVAFDTLSGRTTKWIEDWSKDLAKLMKLHTHEALEEELKASIENGESIQQAELRLKDLPQFDRKRARTTAITEILTASSRSQWEAYNQSPAVTKKRWRHSGSKKNNPRKNHQDMDGVEVGVDEEFVISGSSETCQYPRDPSLSGKERIHCHCVMSPVVDSDILGLSKEEKEQLRQEALEEMDS
ncbi:phage minor head protein [Metabacillus fastidiosus]|uniref:phage minor head protein n=1 Tax=Metabacillus fastidiosus TaxID=1458 RepID=UPI003D2C64E7